MHIGLLSHGVVSPAGLGAVALEGDFPRTEVPNGAGTRTHPVSLVDRKLPELVRWEKIPRLRRASPITYFLMEAVSQALAGAPGIDLSRTGVVATFFLGCLVYSVRFYREMGAEGRRFASPILFPETVFNSPISHVVSTLGLGGPVYSQVGDKSCWASGLRTAECWMRSGAADHVIVVGAEEFDPQALDALWAAGWLRDRGLVPGEGAGALLLTSKGDGCSVRLSGVTDGHGFSSKSGALAAAHSCIGAFPGESPVLPTTSGWTSKVGEKAAGPRAFAVSRSARCEASTATAAWDTIRGAGLLERKLAEELVVPYWGLTQQFAAARLSRSAPAPR